MQLRRKYYQARNEVLSFTKYTTLIEIEKTIEKNSLGCENFVSTCYQMDKTGVPRLRTPILRFQCDELKKTYQFKEETNFFEGYFQFPSFSKSLYQVVSFDLTEEGRQL